MTAGRPRLVSYTSGLWPCGVASYQRHLAAALTEFADVETVRLPAERVLGNDFRALLRQRRRYRELAARSAGCDLAVIDYADTFWNGSRLGENFFPAFARALRAPAAVVLHEGPGRTDPADGTGPLPVRALKRLGHVLFAARDTRALRYEAFVRDDLFRFAAHRVTHSAALAAARPEPVHVLPMPAFPPAEPGLTRREVDDRFGLDGRRVALLLGFPQPSKGFDRAVAALPHLPAEVVLVQAGYSERSEPEGAKLVELAGRLGVGGRFVRTGPLTDPELAALLARADVGLAPFRSVHLSSSLGHLIAAGLPVVSSRTPTAERLAADGAGVRFAECDDPAGFATATLDAMGNEELRRRNLDYARDHGFGAVARYLVGLIPGTAAACLSPLSPWGRGVGGEGSELTPEEASPPSGGARHPSPPAPLPRGERGERRQGQA